jgi:hypothetical protein
MSSNIERLDAAIKDLNAPVHVQEAAKAITHALPRHSVYWGETFESPDGVVYSEKFIEWSNDIDDHDIKICFK